MTHLFSFGCLVLAIVHAGTCDDCNLPPDSGSCPDSSIAKQEVRYYHSAKNLRCAKMPYVGCGGNSNNFKSLAECQEKCAHIPKNIIEEATVGGASSVCWFRNTTYFVGTEVPEVKEVEPCKMDCECKIFYGSAEIVCGPSWECFNGGASPGCVRTYPRGKCCSDEYCPKKDEPHKCLYKGKGYYEGEYIEDEAYPCMKCVCNKNWKGMLTTEGEVCLEETCKLSLRKNFEPSYFWPSGDEMCCPGQ